MNKLRVVKLDGLTPYAHAHQMQLDTVEAVKQREVPNTLYLLEHPPVITLGKNAAHSGVIASSEILAHQGVEVHQIERGGQATYHCPGQLVGYAIMDLHQLKLGVAKYVYLLEEVLIQTCAAFGVTAMRKEGLTGIFTRSGGKIGALGIRVTRGVCFHGFALNVSPNLSGYNLIVPCGLTDTPMASIDSQIAASVPSMDEVKTVAAGVFVDIFS